MSKFIIPNIEEENSITKTIRIKTSITKKLEQLAIENNITFNRLVNECIAYALQNIDEGTNIKIEVTTK